MMHRMRPLLGLLWDGHRREVLLATALLVALSFTEGAGLLSLLPALQLVGVPLGDHGAAGRVAGLLRDGLAWVGATPTLVPVLTLVVVLLAARAAVQMMQARVAARLETDVVQGLRVRLFAAVVDLPWARFVGERPAALMHAVGPQVDDVHSALLLLMQLSAQAVTILASVAVAVALSPAITGVVMVAGVLLVLVARALRLPGRRAGDDLLDSSQRVLVRGTELLGAAKMMKAWGAEVRATDVFASDVGVWARLSRRYANQRAGAAFALSLLSVVLLAVLSGAAIRGAVSPASLLLLLVIYARILPRVADLQHSLSYFWQASSALASVLALLDRFAPTAREARGGQATMQATLPLRTSGAPRIELRHVTVRYEGSDAAALSDFSADFPAGSVTVVTGPSGAGKTTLGDVVLGLLAPATGSVTLDGEPLGVALSAARRERVGYLAQEPMLLHGTLRENLHFGNPLATDDDLRAALAAAACDFVERLPLGLDSPVGDRGVMLSGGERQRIALARTLLRQPDLLVLDEATSALDAETEQRILETVRALKGRCTVVFFTHREAPRAIADQVLEI